jgi:hypothetical protein
MRGSSRLFNRAFFIGATAVTAAGLLVAGLTSAAVGAQANSHSSITQTGPGYPPPGGIYKPFNDCPILNPLMQESVSGSAVICSAGQVASGSVVLGNITTPVVRPVDVQFGGVQTPNANFGGDWSTGISGFSGGILPPPAGLSAMLKTKKDLIPDSLTTALGCSTTTDPVVKNLCTKAINFGGKYLDVYALAQSAGQLTNFGLTTWTQRLKFKLINPLLGNNCYVGNNNQPIVINPNISLGPGGQLEVLPDPNPTKHPSTDVLLITVAIATDTTFTAPGVTGCGPGGAANASIDAALDAGTGLPSASGVNSITLNGSFAIADCFNTSNQAKILLSAFKDSVGTPASARPRATLTFRHGLSASHLRGLLRSMGMR